MSAAAIEDSLPNSNNNDQRRENEEMSTSSTASAIPAAVGAGGAGDSSSSPNSFPPSLEQHCRLLEEENHNLKESDARLQQQYVDSQRRERILMRRLATKEQEIQDYVSQISEYKSAQAPGPAALRSALLDPAVNILFEKLKQELQSTKAKLEETQNELSAWKFTPDSNTGKRLMAKCRLLYQENEELGKMTSNGRLAKLEGELAMQKSFSEEVKKSQSELDDFLQELDEDVEGMQSTILFLQQELKAAKDNITVLEKENYQLKTGGGGCYDMSKSSLMLNGKDTSPHLKNENELSECYDSEERTSKIHLNNYNNLNLNSNSLIAAEDLRTNNSNSKFFNGKESSATRNSSEDDAAQNDAITNSSIECTSSSSCSNINNNNNNNLNINNGNNNNNNNNVSSNSNNNNSNTNNNSNKVIRQNQRKRNYDSDSSEENTSANGRTLRNTTNAKKLKKKTRRSSVLSIDLNEEDTQIADESDEEDSSNHRITTRRKSARNIQNGDNN